ncbi:hypothetical protein [Paenibacillus sp. GYB003]|uniref:hypothetical protein n=1 Tax=Paenibacillus sp. GYB003 TaxID=2994392 RepID=UPI002F96E6F7
MKGYHYLPKRPQGTEQAITSFKRIFPKIRGKVIRITGTFSNKNWYRVKFFTIDGEVYVFKGFSWWYGGSGPQALAACLRRLCISEDVIQKLTDYSKDLHGDKYNPNSFFINLKPLEANDCGTCHGMRFIDLWQGLTKETINCPTCNKFREVI